MSVVAGVVGGFALIWVLKIVFSAAGAVVRVVDMLLRFPSTPVHDR